MFLPFLFTVSGDLSNFYHADVLLLSYKEYVRVLQRMEMSNHSIQVVVMKIRGPQTSDVVWFRDGSFDVPYCLLH